MPSHRHSPRLAEIQKLEEGHQDGGADALQDEGLLRLPHLLGAVLDQGRHLAKDVSVGAHLHNRDTSSVLVLLTQSVQLILAVTGPNEPKKDFSSACFGEFSAFLGLFHPL